MLLNYFTTTSEENKDAVYFADDFLDTENLKGSTVYHNTIRLALVNIIRRLIAMKEAHFFASENIAKIGNYEHLTNNKSISRITNPFHSQSPAVTMASSMLVAMEISHG